MEGVLESQVVSLSLEVEKCGSEVVEGAGNKEVIVYGKVNSSQTSINLFLVYLDTTSPRDLVCRLLSSRYKAVNTNCKVSIS